MPKFSDLLEVCDRSLKKDDAMKVERDQPIKATPASDSDSKCDAEADAEASDEEKVQFNEEKFSLVAKNSKKKVEKNPKADEFEKISADDEPADQRADDSNAENAEGVLPAKEDIYGRKIGEKIFSEFSARSTNSKLFRKKIVNSESDANLEQMRRRLKGLMNRYRA